jgi:hypothetical protein
MSSHFSGSIIGSKKSTIFITGTAGLDNAAGYVKYNGSRKLSENEILNYIISREEKKDKLLMVFQLTWDDRREYNLLWILTTYTLNVDETTGVTQSNQSIVSMHDIQDKKFQEFLM